MEFKNIVFNACRDGKLRRLKLYLDQRPKEESKLIVSLRTNGATPLLIAARNGHLNVIEYLIEKGADIEQVGCVSFDGETIEAAPPLWAAAAAGHLAVVKILISHGANVNSTTKTNSTPLRAACFDGHLEIVKHLIECGADQEIANRHGHTCLMIACYKGHMNIAQYLIANGAQVNRKSVKGNTSLHDCAESGSLEILKLLLSNGAKMTEDSYGMTPLKAGALAGHWPIVELITSLPNCSQLEKIDALELLGSTYIDKKHDLKSALDFWRKALEERNNCDNSPVLKSLLSPNMAYDYAVEFKAVEELEELICDPDLMRMQSLLIRERILGPSHPDTSYYIRYRGAVYADSGNFNRCISLWMYALEMQQKIFEPLSTMTQSSLLSFVELFSLMMSKSVSTVRFSDLFAVLQRSIHEIEVAMSHSSDVSSNDHYLTNYNRTLNIILHFLGLLCRLTPILSPAQEHELKSACYRLVRLNPRGKNGSHLLHMACDTSFSLFPFYEIPLIEVLKLILEVVDKDSVNVVDNEGNTPLHIAASLKHCSTPVFKILLNSGAHLDARNSSGKVALELATNSSLKPYEIFPLKHISLQCLCAQTINRYRIPFKGKIANYLEKFIKAH